MSNLGRPRETNKHWIIGSVAIVDLSSPKHPRASTLIDATDLPVVFDGQGKWYAAQTGRTGIYACRNRYREPQDKLARKLLGLGEDQRTDHRSGNTLNNRRKNLRPASPIQNASNGCRKKTTGFKGVNFHKSVGKWQVKIGVGYRQIYLGVYDDPVEAARVYDTAALVYHGEFAKLNFERTS